MHFKYKRHILTLCFALCGIGMSLVAGMYQAEQESKKQMVELSHEINQAMSSIEKNILKTVEIGRLFQMATTVPRSSLNDQSSLLLHYNQINPQESIPGFKNVLIVKSASRVLSSVPEAAQEILIKNGWPDKNVLNSMDAAEKTSRPSWAFFPPQELLFVSFKSATPKATAIVLGVSPYVFFNKSLAFERNTPFSLVVSYQDQDQDKAGIIYRSTQNIQSDDLFATKTMYLEGLDFRFRFYKTQTFLYSPWPTTTVFIGSLFFLLLSLVLFQTMTTKEEAEARAQEITNRLILVEDKYKKINEDIPGLVMILNKKNEVVEINKEGRFLAENGFGGIDSFVNGQEFSDLFNFVMSGAKNSPPTKTIKIKTLGDNKWVSLSFSEILLDGEKHVLVLGSDISEIMQMSQQLDTQNQKLHFLAVHDPLTNLFNRRAFEEKVEDFVFKKTPFSLLYVDLDQFKIVNDTAGHMAGDRLLAQISTVLREKSFPYFAARLGGDEFGFVVSAPPEISEKVAQKILSACQEFVFEWDGKNYQITASIGVSHSSSIEASLNRKLNKEDMMSCADSACYISKKQGRNRIHVFSNDLESSLHRQEMEWTVRVQEAIANNKLVLYKQKIKKINDSSYPEHAEILVRLLDDNGKIIQAADFIPAIERFGLMPILDKWVISSAVKYLSSCSLVKENLFCLNVSGQTLSDPCFDDYLCDLVKESGIDPRNICIEITETAAIKNINRLSDIIPKSRGLGIQVALDDFGVGMSSFSYLKKFKADYIKIDGSFIRDLDVNPMSSSIVEAIVSLAHQFGMKVVAEFVPSQAVEKLLGKMGVEFGQGYFYSHPEPLFAATPPPAP